MRDGWFHTGDAAVVHPDGYVEIRDRLKDVIISGGENISSVEVEGVLLRHPAVQEVAVVGLPRRAVGRGAARLRRAAGRRVARPRTSCAQFAREHLAHFKVPHSFTSVTELPKTATGKIQKYVLRKGRPEHRRAVALRRAGRRSSIPTARPQSCAKELAVPASMRLAQPRRLLPSSLALSCDAPRPVVLAKPGRDLAVAVPESVGVSTERLKRLDAGMKGLVTDGKVAGIVSLLTRHGKTVHLTAHGVKDIRSGAPITRDSIFRIYSMTKPVTGVAMLMLYEEGKWRLDDPVSRYIPEFAKLKVWVGENPDGTPKTEPARRLDDDARADDALGRPRLRAGGQPRRGQALRQGQPAQPARAAAVAHRPASPPCRWWRSPARAGPTASPSTCRAIWWRSCRGSRSPISCARACSSR